MESSFSELVRKTEGMQPWRRLFHAGNGIILVLLLQRLPAPKPTVLLALGSLLAALVLLDAVRLLNPGVNRVFFKAFAPLASPREAGKMASSTWYLLGVLLTLGIFPWSTALPGILVLALADPAAGAVGRAWGTRGLGKGTVEGSGAFALVAFGTLLFFVSWPLALLAALVTTTVEALPLPLDDNLTIPLVTSGALTFLL